jgi:hypothetical protein
MPNDNWKIYPLLSPTKLLFKAELVYKLIMTEEKTAVAAEEANEFQEDVEFLCMAAEERGLTCSSIWLLLNLTESLGFKLKQRSESMVATDSLRRLIAKLQLEVAQEPAASTPIYDPYRALTARGATNREKCNA